MAFERIHDNGVSNLPKSYTCLTADVKPVVDESGVAIVKNSTCWEYDGKVGFIFDGTTWWEV